MFCLHFKKKYPPWSQFGTLMFMHDKSLSAMWSSRSLVSRFSVCWRLSDKLKGSPCARELQNTECNQQENLSAVRASTQLLKPGSLLFNPTSRSHCVCSHLESKLPWSSTQTKFTGWTAEAPPFRHIWNSVKAERSAPTLSWRIATQ